MIRALKAWGPAAVWAALLFLSSELSSLPSGPDLPAIDKIGHFVLYGVLGAALGWGRRMARLSIPHWVLVAVGSAYGALEEWHQSFVPGRSPELADFLVDAVGVTAGYVIFLWIATRLAGRPEGEAQSHDARTSNEGADPAGEPRPTRSSSEGPSSSP